MTLQCIACRRSVTFREVPTPAPNCAHCGAREWRNVDEPAKDYRLSTNDKRFLRSLRIAVDDPPEA